VVADALPEAIVMRVWARREGGEPAIDISLWLSRIGYLVAPEDVAAIVSRYRQQLDAQTRTVGGDPRQ
jgi:hypothetical protein